MLEMKAALSKMLLNYKLVASPKNGNDLKYKMDLVLRPLDGVFMKLLKRENR
jgi:hypothetical protein